MVEIPQEPEIPEWIIDEALGDNELLILLLQRESLFRDFAEKGGEASLDENDIRHRDELKSKITGRKEHLGIDSLEE